MIFVTNAEFMRVVDAWERKLPEFDAFCGIPRCGVWPAVMLALKRNKPLLSLEQMYLGAVGHAKRILVVDDNGTARAQTFNKVKARLTGCPFVWEYGLVYRSTPRPSHSAVDVPQGPIFEYDWHRRHYVTHLALDMDGVICEDFVGAERCEDDPHYLHFLENAKPIRRFNDRAGSPLQLGAIVTGRLERYRPQTQAWLAKHGIKYRHLSMYPGSLADRRRRDDAWQTKADFVKSYPREDLWFFVESSPKQAKAIAEAANRMVWCPTNSTVYQPLTSK